MSLAAMARLDSLISPQIDDWVRQSDDLAARLNDLDGNHLHGLAHAALTSSSAGRAVTVRSSSSMAPALLHRFDAAAANPPSLSSSLPDTDATPTETSISTALASQFSGLALLEDRNGILELPAATRTPVYECAFWFLNCSLLFASQPDWQTHCLSHFRGEEPPRRVQCPLCDWSTTHPDGAHAWTARMQHLAGAHTMRGQTLRTSRPDFHLFHHLWQKRLIDDYDLKELQGGNHNLTSAVANFVETNGRLGTRRGDRRRVQRSQHVAATQQPVPRP